MPTRNRSAQFAAPGSTEVIAVLRLLHPLDRLVAGDLGESGTVMFAEHAHSTRLFASRGRGRWGGSLAASRQAARSSAPGASRRAIEAVAFDRLIEELCHRFASLSPHTADDGEDCLLLPPAHWVNDQLAALGLACRVQAVDGYRYEVYELVAADPT